MKLTRKHICLAFALLLIAISTAFAYSSNITAKSADYVEGEVLVVMKSAPMASAVKSAAKMSSASAARICASAAASLAGSVNATSVQTYNALSASSGNVFAHLRSKTKTADELITELKKDTRVLAVSKNYISKIANTTPNDPKWSEQWGPKTINAPAAWDTTTGSNDVVVAVLDTGVIYDHEDLAANMWRGASGDYGRMFHDNGSFDVITGTGGTSGATLTDWARVGDINGHGTHCAGIIGAVGSNGKGVAGVNWNVKILTVGVFTLMEDDDGLNVGAYDTDTINGLNYITGLKNSGVNIMAANMSFGGESPVQADDSVYGQALRTASEAGGTGILICMAAGNEASNLDELKGEDGTEYRNYPSAFRFAGTLSVGATQSDDKRASYSNYSPSGKWVDVFAPGTEILSTCRSSSLSEYPADKQAVHSTGYRSINGTSLATPMVAGAAALLSAARPGWTAADIKSLLINNATSICKTGFSKYGQIDLGAAMNASKTDKVFVSSISLGGSGAGTTSGNAFQTSSNSAQGSSMYIGDMLQINATVSPPNALNSILAWDSSDTAVATVDTDGLVTAHSAGTAVIMAKATDASGESASYAVTVTEKPQPQPEPTPSSGGGGCSAGLGAAALLFAVLAPVIYRRRH